MSLCRGGIVRLRPRRVRVVNGAFEKYDRRGELEITDVNNAYIQEGTMTYGFLKGWWTDAGTFESLLRATNLVAGTRGVSPMGEPLLQTVADE